MKIYTLEEIKNMKVEEAFWKINGEILKKDYEPYEEKTLGEPAIIHNNIHLFNIGDGIGIWYEIKETLINQDEGIVEKRMDLHITNFESDFNYLSCIKKDEEKRKYLTEKYGKPGEK